MLRVRRDKAVVLRRELAVQRALTREGSLEMGPKDASTAALLLRLVVRGATATTRAPIDLTPVGRTIVTNATVSAEHAPHQRAAHHDLRPEPAKERTVVHARHVDPENQSEASGLHTPDPASHVRIRHETPVVTRATLVIVAPHDRARAMIDPTRAKRIEPDRRVLRVTVSEMRAATSIDGRAFRLVTVTSPSATPRPNDEVRRDPRIENVN